MKKSLIILALLPLLFFGCKKGGSTEEPKPEEKRYKLSFSTTGFNQNITSIQSKANTSNSNSLAVPAEDKMSSLELLIFGGDGKLVYSKTNYLIDAFGMDIPDSDKFNVKLPKGDYKVGMVAHNKSIKVCSVLFRQ